MTNDERTAVSLANGLRLTADSFKRCALFAQISYGIDIASLIDERYRLRR